MKTIGRLIAIALIGLFLTGCGQHQRVEQGELGRLLGRAGWNDELHGASNVWVGMFSKLVRLDATEHLYAQQLNILCADNLNIKATIETRCGLNLANKKEILNVFDRIKGGNDLISGQRLYEVYGKLVVESVPRDLLSALRIDEIRARRAELGKIIEQKVKEELATTPLLVRAVKLTNIDWPEVVTNAMEAKKKMQVEKDTQQAQIEKEFIKKQGELKIAEEQYKIDLLEARKIADTNTLIAESLKENPEYLQWHTIKVLGEAAKGPNNAFILIPYDLVGTGLGQDLSNSVLLKQMLKK